ncbi:MAG: hypothetical protein QOD77_1140 [Thermoplasmata archaeon]|jgi:hypothetical protein|nr:hypothetical protein [Thermoplasmata archaeon]
MRSILVAGLLATALLAGCTSPDGETAQDAFSVARSEARDRHSDAILVGAFGLEVRSFENKTMGANVDPDSDQGRFVAALAEATDETVGDGHAPAWGFNFVSAADHFVISVAVVDGKMAYAFEQELPMAIPQEDIDDIRAKADTWSVDSVEAMDALRASNATLDAAITAGNMTTVEYRLDLEDQEWEIDGRAEGLLSFGAVVGIETAAVSDLKVKLYGGKPILPKPTKILPEAIHEQGTFTVSFDPLNLQGGGICNTPTAECFEYPFEVEGAPVDFDATLAWGLSANDLDFYIYEGDSQLYAGTNDLGNPTTGEAITGNLPAGEYRVIVVGWNAAGESFNLDVEFS